MKKVFNAFANRKFALVFAMLIICSASAFAQDISAGQNAMTQVTNEIQQYLPLVVNLCYALAGIFAVVGAVSVYIAMNNALFWTATNVLKCTDIEQFAKT